MFPSVFSVYFHSVLLKVAEVKQCVLELQFRKVELMVEGKKLVILENAWVLCKKYCASSPAPCPSFLNGLI